MNFKPEQTYTFLSGLAILVIAGLLGYHLLVPMPKGPDAVAVAVERQQLETQIEQQRVALGLVRERLAEMTWTGGDEEIAASSLARVTQLTNARRLRLIAFRPQRLAEEQGLTMLPFHVAVEGPYPAVVGLLGELETPVTRLAVNMVQITSVDAASDRVTATIGVVAFRVAE
jgi:hypothetical protein